MSACPSLPISATAVRAGRVVVGPDRVPVDLLAVLAQVEDPRARRGIRHELVAILAIAVCAVLAGARTYTAIAEWAHDLPVGVRVRLGVGRRPPSESTIRRTLQTVDAQALDRVVSTWLVTRSTPPLTTAPVRGIAIDGKSARGARGPDGRAVHLLAALDHDSGIVVGQTVVDGKSNEITAFAPLLNRIDITDVITVRVRSTPAPAATTLAQRVDFDLETTVPTVASATCRSTRSRIAASRPVPGPGSETEIGEDRQANSAIAAVIVLT